MYRKEPNAAKTYKLLMFEALHLSGGIAERLEELYRKYPSQELREAIELLHRANLGIESNPFGQDAAQKRDSAADSADDP